MHAHTNRRQRGLLFDFGSLCPISQTVKVTDQNLKETNLKCFTLSKQFLFSTPIMFKSGTNLVLVNTPSKPA